MKKTTKKEARKAYDDFFGVLRCFNGGTAEENRRMSPACFERLTEVAERTAVIAQNPNVALAKDEWLMEAITETIPARLESFKIRYEDILSEPTNIIPFAA